MTKVSKKHFVVGECEIPPTPIDVTCPIKANIIESCTSDNTITLNENSTVFNKTLVIDDMIINGKIKYYGTDDIIGKILLGTEDGFVLSDVPESESGIPEAPIDGKQYVRKDATWVEVSPSVISSNITLVLSGSKSVGRYTNGQTIPCAGWTLDQFVNDIAVEYLTPSFSAFSIDGQANPIEVGTIIIGSKNFLFSSSNTSNIKPSSISILDGATVLVSGQPVSSPVTAILPSTTRLTPSTNTWKIIGENTLSNTFERTYSVAWGYRTYAGSTTTPAPTTGLEVRTALLGTSVVNQVNSFNFQTGNVNRTFIIAIPQGKNLVKALNTDTNDDLTTLFLLSGITTVPDVAGNNINYKVYIATFASAYSGNNNVQVTLS